MGETRGTCLMCAWRENCQKRFSVKTDGLLNVICPDYTRDMRLKEADLAKLERQYPDVVAKSVTRSMDQLVEDQLSKWRGLMTQNVDREQPAVKGPVITLSREPGSGGIEIVRRLSALLGMDLMGGQIIQHVAESTKMSTKVIETLDEKEVSIRDNWITSLFESRHLWPDTYLQHLTKVISTIGRYGNAIIIGRGAHYILPPEDIFKLRVIAPLETKIENMMRYRPFTREEAEAFVIKMADEQKAFAKKYFHADISDPAQYDMVINTGRICPDAAVQAAEVAFKYWWQSRPTA